MKIQVLDDDGSTMFESDTNSTMGVAPAVSEKAKVAAALREAAEHVGSDHHVIASIKADIQNVVWRIETELGAHPAFTWAQTKLKNAGAHLDHYARGIWSEPPANSVTVDERGIQITGNVTITADSIATPAA